MIFLNKSLGLISSIKASISSKAGCVILTPFFLKSALTALSKADCVNFFTNVSFKVISALFFAHEVTSSTKDKIVLLEYVLPFKQDSSFFTTSSSKRFRILTALSNQVSLIFSIISAFLVISFCKKSFNDSSNSSGLSSCIEKSFPIFEPKSFNTSSGDFNSIEINAAKWKGKS